MAEWGSVRRWCMVSAVLLVLAGLGLIACRNRGECMQVPVCEKGRFVRSVTQCCKDGPYACEWDGYPRVCSNKTCVGPAARCPEDPPAQTDVGRDAGCLHTSHKVC